MYQFLDLTMVIVCGTNQTAKLIKQSFVGRLIFGGLWIIKNVFNVTKLIFNSTKPQFVNSILEIIT